MISRAASVPWRDSTNVPAASTAIKVNRIKRASFSEAKNLKIRMKKVGLAGASKEEAVSKDLVVSSRVSRLKILLQRDGKGKL